MLSLFLATILSSQPVLIAREPRPADLWTQSVSARCGRSRIEISGYGVARPLNRRPSILINGRSIHGRGSAQLLADLARRSAGYRIEILCGSREITIRIRVGERDPGKAVRFWSGAAYFDGSKLVSYTGLQEGDERSFWFR